MAGDMNRFVGSAVAISSKDDEQVASFEVATSKPVDMVRSSDTMRQVDNNFRHHSHKLIGKFRKIRHTSKPAHEGERKFSVVATDTLEDRGNRTYLLAKSIGVPILRRQSAVIPSFESRLLADSHLKPKGILKSSAKSSSDTNLNQDSTENLGELRFDHLITGSTTLTKGERDSDDQSSSSCQNSNQSLTHSSSKLVKHVKFLDDILAN